ncbi:hypothetical protein MBLNU457_5322t1 [Dothideomycetes sp. NU457]
MYAGHQHSQSAYGFSYPTQAYGQPQWPTGYAQTAAPPQYGQTQPYGQPPPAKRHKPTSSAIVTRYPPPPGYVPPPNAQIPGYTPPVQQQYPGYAGYNPQDYAQYQQQYQQAYAAQGYAQQAGWQQSQAYPGYPQAPGYPQYPTAQPQSQAYLQPSAPPHARAASVSQAAAQPHSYQPASTVPAKRSFSQPNLTLPKTDITAEETGLDFDWGFDELFPEDTTPFRDDDTSRPELSLKLIIWHPAVHVKTPLPSTSEESQTYTLTPVKTGEDGPFSKYFIGKLTTEIEVNVRQTAEWDQVKDDPIFVKFAASSKLIPIHVVRRGRERPALDHHRGTEVNANSRSPDDNDQNAPEVTETEEVVEDAEDPTHGDEAMDMDSDDEDEEEEEPQQDAPNADTTTAPNLLDNLEQALGADGGDVDIEPVTQNVQVVKADAKSGFDRDRRQGANKSRAKRRRSQQSNGSHSEHEKPRSTRQRVKGPYGPHHQPPPPSGPPPDYNPWKAFEADSRGPHSPESTASQHTTVASPIRQDEDETNTPARMQQAPAETTNSGRKRGYDDFSRSSGDGGRRRQEADHPKRKRQPPYVPDVYSRRW